MNKRFHSVKLMPVWLAISSAVIIAGIILYCLFGRRLSCYGTHCLHGYE